MIAGYLAQLPRTALLIDGANIFAAAKTLRINIDYKAFLDYFERQNNIVRANYYTAVRKKEEGVDDPLIKLIDWLSDHGYKVITKQAMDYTNSRGESVTKGNMDVRMTVDAMQMLDHVDHFILATGDGDFADLVHVIQARGLYVTAVSTRETQPPMISTLLRREVDRFIDLVDIAEHICR